MHSHDKINLNFANERIDDADFSGARLHSASFEGAKVTDALLCNADISGDITGLRLNGVEIAPLVIAELDRLFPERVLLRAPDPDGLRLAWATIERVWRETLERARALPEEKLHERVDGEWSFIETLRHLVMATDLWLQRMVHGMVDDYHPWGIGGSWLDPASYGLDPAADPSLDEIVAVRRERMAMVDETIAALDSEELERVCVPPDTTRHPNKPHKVIECLHVILDEEWEHSRYANRDLALLEASTPHGNETL